jgi:hypothetical protein
VGGGGEGRSHRAVVVLQDCEAPPCYRPVWHTGPSPLRGGANGQTQPSRQWSTLCRPLQARRVPVHCRTRRAAVPNAPQQANLFSRIPRFGTGQIAACLEPNRPQIYRCNRTKQTTGSIGPRPERVGGQACAGCAEGGRAPPAGPRPAGPSRRPRPPLIASADPGGRGGESADVSTDRTIR